MKFYFCKILFEKDPEQDNGDAQNWPVSDRRILFYREADVGRESQIFGYWEREISPIVGLRGWGFDSEECHNR